MSLRIEVVQRDGERESPFWEGPVVVRASAKGLPEVSAQLTRAHFGIGEVLLPFGGPVRGPVTLELSRASGQSLAAGAVSLDRTRWAARARRRGGWIRGRANGALSVSVAPQRGALRIGSAEPLVVRVERAGRALPNASLIATVDGGRLIPAPPLRTDDRGRATFSFEATALNPTLRVEARDASGEVGLLDSVLPVAAGAFAVHLAGHTLRVESDIAQNEAFYSVVTEAERVSGGVLALQPNGRGGAVGSAEIAALPPAAFLVVSSEVDQNSPGTVGWPSELSDEPAQTFDVPDALLLDGLPRAFVREQQRRSRVRWLCAAFVACSLVLCVLLLVLGVRAADRDLSRHLHAGLDAETTERVAPRRLLAVLASVLALSLGFIVLLLVSLARLK